MKAKMALCSPWSPRVDAGRNRHPEDAYYVSKGRIYTEVDSSKRPSAALEEAYSTGLENHRKWLKPVSRSEGLGYAIEGRKRVLDPPCAAALG